MKVFTAAATLCLTMLAIGTGIASAAEFKANKYPTGIFGVQGGAHVPEPPPATTTAQTMFGFENTLMGACEFVSFSQELAKASSSLTVTPFVEECAAFQSQSGTVTTNGCQNRFNAGSESGGEFLGTLDIVCPEGKAIVVAGNGCEVQIGSQTNLSTVHYRNETQETDPQVAVEFQVSGLKYTKTKDVFPCALLGTGVMTSGLIKGGMTLKGKEASNPLRVE